jgi:hypothetical protein
VRNTNYSTQSPTGQKSAKSGAESISPITWKSQDTQSANRNLGLLETIDQ